MIQYKFCLSDWSRFFNGFYVWSLPLNRLGLINEFGNFSQPDLTQTILRSNQNYFNLSNWNKYWQLHAYWLIFVAYWIQIFLQLMKDVFWLWHEFNPISDGIKNLAQVMGGGWLCPLLLQLRILLRKSKKKILHKYQ